MTIVANPEVADAFWVPMSALRERASWGLGMVHIRNVGPREVVRVAGELPSVRLQKGDLEVLDPPIRLHLSVELDRLVEDVESAILAAAHHLAPADEQASISHGFLLGVG